MTVRELLAQMIPIVFDVWLDELQWSFTELYPETESCHGVWLLQITGEIGDYGVHIQTEISSAMASTDDREHVVGLARAILLDLIRALFAQRIEQALEHLQAEHIKVPA